MRLHPFVLGKIDEWNKYVYSLVDYQKGVCNKKDLFHYNLMFFWPCIMNWLYINYQIDALIIIYSLNTILLYMFRALSAHLQEDIVVYKQHMVPSLSSPGGLSIRS